MMSAAGFSAVKQAGIHYLRRFGAGLGAAALFAGFSLPGAGAAQNPPPAAFGAWQKTCSTPPGTPSRVCELTQVARAKDRPDISFRVSFIKLPQKKGTLLRVIVPIRVELPMGVGVNIDGNKDMGNMLYRRCFADSCLAAAVLSDKDMENFFTAKQLVLFIFPTPEEGVGGALSLNGLKAGYDSLP